MPRIWRKLKQNKLSYPRDIMSLNNDQQVSLDILARICLELKCGFDDIVQIESVKRDN